MGRALWIGSGKRSTTHENGSERSWCVFIPVHLRFSLGCSMPASQSHIVAPMGRCLARDAMHRVVAAPDPRGIPSSSSANSEVNSIPRGSLLSTASRASSGYCRGRRTSDPLRRSCRRSRSGYGLGAAAVAAYFQWSGRLSFGLIGARAARMRS